MNLTKKPNLNIGTRIFLGFGLVIILFVAQAMFSHFDLKKIAVEFTNYGQINSEAFAILEIERTALDLQRSVLAYTNSGYSSIVRRVEKLEKDLEGSILTVEDKIKDKEGREILERMRVHVQLYMENFKSAVKLHKKRDQLLKEEINIYQQQIEANLNSILLVLLNQNNLKAAALAEAANLQFLRAHNNINIFLRNLDSLVMQNTIDKLSLHEKGLDKLMAHTTDTVSLEKLKIIIQLIPSYKKAFIQVVQATRSYMHLVYIVMTGESTEIRYLANELKKHILGARGTVESNMDSHLKRARDISLIILAFATILGFIFAWRITRNTTQPLKELTEKAKMVARGNLDVHIDTDGKDETARLAQSFSVMRLALKSFGLVHFKVDNIV